MPGKAIGIQMNLGFPGSFSRSGDSVIAARMVKETDPTGPSFGDPVILNADNTYTKMGAGHAAAAFAGVACREVKQAVTWPNQATVGYLPGQICDVLQRGSVSVICHVGVPTAGGDVYVRITANGAIPAGVVGGFEADADGGNSVKITNAEWTTGAIDSNKVAEITMKTRNRA